MGFKSERMNPRAGLESSGAAVECSVNSVCGSYYFHKVTDASIQRSGSLALYP